MADFCKQCSLENFGEDIGDLAGLTTEEDSKNYICAFAICEGCGPTYVDHKGKCIYSYCLLSHGDGNQKWSYHDLPRLPSADGTLGEGS